MADRPNDAHPAGASPGTKPRSRSQGVSLYLNPGVPVERYILDTFAAHGRGQQWLRDLLVTGLKHSGSAPPEVFHPVPGSAGDSSQ